VLFVDQISGQNLENAGELELTAPRLKILLADDNPSLLRRVRRVLEQDFEVVGTVADGCALIEQSAQLHPEVIVADISMPNMDGFEAISRLRGRTEAKVIFLTVHEEQAFVEEAKALGALGYVLKRSSKTVLAEAIRSAAEGRFFLCPELRNPAEDSL
jgi:DNA-binding NarL/FixJ family response regulator